MQPNDLIKKIMITFNSFDTRLKILTHVFFVNGNGLYWDSNGEIQSYQPEFKQDVSEMTNSEIESYPRMIAIFENSPPKVKSQMTERLTLKHEFLKLKFEFKKNNLDKITNEYFNFNDKFSYIDYIDSFNPNSLLNNIPKNASKEWIDVINEFLNYLNINIKESWLNSNDFNDEKWIDSKAYIQYKSIKKIKNKLI